MSRELEARARRTLSEVEGLSSSRLRHTAGVARRAADVGTALLAAGERQPVLAAAWVHDIGYAPALVETGCHPIDGARQLRRLAATEQVVSLVAYHSGAEYEAEERGLREELTEFQRPPDALLDVLTYADMTTDENGHVVSVETRMRGILERYGDNDPVRVSIDSSRMQLVATVRRVESRLASMRGTSVKRG